MYGSRIPNRKSSTGACRITVGVDVEIPALGNPTVVTRARIYLHSLGERVKACSGYSICLDMVVFNAAQTYPLWKYPTRILSTQVSVIRGIASTCFELFLDGEI